jgi:hypothetical protein
MNSWRSSECERPTETIWSASAYGRGRKRNAIHCTEDCGGGSDAERESQQDADGKHRIAMKTPKRVANVLKGCLHSQPRPYVSFSSHPCQDPAKREQLWSNREQ